MWGAPAVVTSAFGSSLPDDLRTEVAVLLPPTDAWLPGGHAMDVSVHAVQAGRLREVLSTVFSGPAAACASHRNLHVPARHRRSHAVQAGARAQMAVPLVHAVSVVVVLKLCSGCSSLVNFGHLRLASLLPARV